MIKLVSCTFMSVLLVADGFTVHGPSAPLVAPMGSSVVLPCYIGEVSLMNDLEVEWKRADSETLVHLYQDGESRPEVQQQDYHDRAHFFAEEIQHGNFSLRLDNLTAQDEGEYRCKVFIQHDSGEIVAEIKVGNERLLVSGSNHPVSAYVGEDVTLNCSVDSHITPEHIEEVSWMKTDILVLLYQNNETLPDSSNEQFRGRVEFFTAEIPKGNFSLRLKSVRTEDKGVYMCRVFAGELSANATVELGGLGFSVLHIMTMTLCMSAFGSALLLCFLIYCRSQHKETIFRLQMFLVFCPNILMFLAFLLWGFSEGSLYESVSCCALYFLRPLLLLWAAPYIKEFTGQIYRWILYYSYDAEYVFLSVAVYSALLASGWQRIMSFAEFDRNLIIVMFVIMFLYCFCRIIYFLLKEVGNKSGRAIKIFNAVALMIFDILPTLQFIILFYTFGSARAGLIIIILPMLMMMMNYRMYVIFEVILDCSESVSRTAFIILTIVANAAMMFFYISTLDDKTDAAAWGCVLVLMQMLWMIFYFVYWFGLSRCFDRDVPVYVFGSVAVVVLNSVLLMTELILKTVTADRTIGDLRFIAFPSECLFAFFLLISILFPSKIQTFLEFCQKCPARRSQQNQNQNQNTTQTQTQEDVEIPLNTRDQEENQPE